MEGIPTIPELKRAIRREKLLWRKSLSPDEAREKSSRIAAAVRALPEYAGAKSILFYVSAKANEVDTHGLIREAISKNLRALVPVTDFDRGLLRISEIKAFAELIPGRFGLLEPAAESLRIASVHDVDVIIVPGVAFDSRCRRVGFGGGYYDRLLSTSRAPAIALGYDGQMIEEAPVDRHDVPVDILVTERAIYRNPKKRLVPLSDSPIPE